jgi:hypothetical protein
MRAATSFDSRVSGPARSKWTGDDDEEAFRV